MKKLYISIAIIFVTITSLSYSLPNFKYSAIAYTSPGQIITKSPLANVEISITDGSNVVTQSFTNVPVNEQGVFSLNVNTPELRKIKMVTGTNIIIKVNEVKVIDLPLSSWYFFNNTLGSWLNVSLGC
jgi:hypothetical protein